MGIQVGDNFDHKSKKPLDNRISYATLALMKAVTDANIYEGCEAYCVETDKYYKFLSSNTVDETTGKWRERESGGGGTSDYADLSNKPKINNVTLSGNKSASDLKLQGEMQFTTMPTAGADYLGKVVQFLGTTDSTYTHGYYYECVSDGASTPTYSWSQTNVQPSSGGSYSAGDGIDITNDVISTEKSQSGDIDEIVDIIPTAGRLVSIVNAFNKGDIYSTSEKMIGQWTDGKPLYQKVVTATLGASSTTIDVSSLDIETFCFSKGMINNGSSMIPIPYVNDTMYFMAVNYYSIANDTITIISKNMENATVHIAIQYTKTTDTAISIGEETEYSTDEKVIGTWINGKPIYQKTITGTLPAITQQEMAGNVPVIVF